MTDTARAPSHGTIAAAPPAPRAEADALVSALAVVLAGLAGGQSVLSGLRPGADVAAAADAMVALGARIARSSDAWVVWGTGNGCLLASDAPLAFEGAPVAAALVLGLVATYDMATRLPASASRLPGGTMLNGALAEMGVQLDEGAAALSVHGPRVAAPVQADCAAAAPATAAAMLLAGLNAPGVTSVRLPQDMPRAAISLLRLFGAPLAETNEAGSRTVAVTGQADLAGARIDLARLAAATVIAIDGPAGGGKGTLARRIADYYHLNHLDTGLTYRAVAQALLARGKPLDDVAAAEEAAREVDLTHLDREVLAAHAVGEAASRVAVIASVRRILVDKQRSFAAVPPGAVLDGRDIGTVVCPDAGIKLYVTARAEVRAARRLAEIEAHGGEADFDRILADIRRRDERDMGRADSPLRPAEDAHLLDTSEMDIEAAFRAAREIIDQALAAGKRD